MTPLMLQIYIWSHTFFTCTIDQRRNRWDFHVAERLSSFILQHLQRRMKRDARRSRGRNNQGEMAETRIMGHFYDGCHCKSGIQRKSKECGGASLSKPWSTEVVNEMSEGIYNFHCLPQKHEINNILWEGKNKVLQCLTSSQFGNGGCSIQSGDFRKYIFSSAEFMWNSTRTYPARSATVTFSRI